MLKKGLCLFVVLSFVLLTATTALAAPAATALARRALMAQSQTGTAWGQGSGGPGGILE